ncbi:MAG: tetratricopeptide repeat protein [Caldilineaceae bacterium]|nr:tetratricopeptide repeat protein [Caldilineaceae bacterium]
MADVTLTSQHTRSYPDLFRRMILNGAEAILEESRRNPTIQDAYARSEHLRNRALHTLRCVMSMPDAWPLTRDLLLMLAEPMERAGHRADWIRYLEVGLDEAVERKELAVAAEISYQLGLLYQHVAAYRQAEAHLHRCLACNTELGDDIQRARALNFLAYIAYLQRNYNDAHQFVQQALSLGAGDPERRAWSLMVIGCLAQIEARWQDALHSWRESLTVWQAIGDRKQIAYRLRDVGLACMYLEQYADAIEYYRQALTLAEDVADPVNCAITQMNLAVVYFQDGRPQYAIPLLKDAATTLRRFDDGRHLAMAYNNLGLTYTALGLWHEAEQAYLASVDLWQQTGDTLSLAETVDGLGMVYLSQQAFAEATVQFERSLALVADDQDAPRQHLRAQVTEHLLAAQAGLKQTPIVS